MKAADQMQHSPIRQRRPSLGDDDATKGTSLLDRHAIRRYHARFTAGGFNAKPSAIDAVGRLIDSLMVIEKHVATGSQSERRHGGVNRNRLATFFDGDRRLLRLCALTRADTELIPDGRGVRMVGLKIEKHPPQ